MVRSLASMTSPADAEEIESEERRLYASRHVGPRGAGCPPFCPYAVLSGLVVHLPGPSIVRFSSPANFEIESPTAIYGGLSSSVFP